MEKKKKKLKKRGGEKIKLDETLYTSPIKYTHVYTIHQPVPPRGSCW